MNSKLINYISKNIFIILLIGILIGLSFFFGLKWQATNTLLQEELQTSALQQIEFIELEKGIARAESEVASEKKLRAELESRYGEQFEIIQEDLKKLKAKPYIISNTTQVVEGGTVIVEDTNFPPEYLFTSKDGMSLAEYTYEDRIFTATSYDLKVNSSVIVSVDKYGNQLAHVIGSIESSDPEDTNTYPMEVTNSELTFTRPDKNSVFFAPHAMGGISLGASFIEEGPKFSGAGSLIITGWAVGKTKDDNIIRFPGVGGYMGSEEIGGQLHPILYNIGSSVPIISDLWISPSIGYSNKGISAHVTISSTF